MRDVQVSPQQRSLADTSADFWPWPERPELVNLVREDNPLQSSPRPKAKGRHSGAIKGRDALLCRSVCIDLLTGELSEREIAARHQIGRETLHAIRDVMRERGEMRPLEQAIRGGLSNCIVLMLLRLREALIAGEYSPSQIPISLCALIDKKGQLDAGIVPGTQLTEAEAWESATDVAWRALQRAKAVAGSAVVGQAEVRPSEVHSEPMGAQVVDVQASVSPATAPATAPATRPAPEDRGQRAEDSGQPGPVQTSAPTAAAEASSSAQEGGGGVTRAPAPPLPDWDTPQNFGPKEPS